MGRRDGPTRSSGTRLPGRIRKEARRSFKADTGSTGREGELASPSSQEPDMTIRAGACVGPNRRRHRRAASPGRTSPSAAAPPLPSAESVPKDRPCRSHRDVPSATHRRGHVHVCSHRPRPTRRPAAPGASRAPGPGPAPAPDDVSQKSRDRTKCALGAPSRAHFHVSTARHFSTSGAKRTNHLMTCDKCLIRAMRALG